MEATQDDVFSRLNAAIEDWNAQIASSHRDLSEQISHAQAHLARLLDPASAPPPPPREIAAPRPPADPVAIEERDARIASLEDQVQSLLAEIEQLQEALAAASAPPAADPARIELQEALARREAEVATRDGLIASLEMEVTALRQANEQSSTDESYLESVAAELMALQETAAAHEARAESLVAENRQLQDTIAALESAQAQAADHAAPLAAEVDALRTQVAALEEARTAAETARAHAEAARVATEEALAAARAELEALRETPVVAESTASLEEATARALEDLRGQYDTALTANQELENALRESREEAAALLSGAGAGPMPNEALDALREELQATQAELDVARAALLEASPAAEEAASLRELLHQVEQQRAYLEGEAARMREEMESLRAQVARLESAPPPAPAGAEGPANALSEDALDLLIKAFDGDGHKKRMGEILVEQGVLTAEQLHGILNEQSRDPQRRFGTLVVERGYTSEAMVARILAAQLRLPFVELTPESIDPKAPPLISAHLARLHRAVPVRQELGKLVLAMANPLDLIAIEDIELASKCHVDPVVATLSSIEAAFKRFYAQPY